MTVVKRSVVERFVVGTSHLCCCNKWGHYLVIPLVLGHHHLFSSSSQNPLLHLQRQLPSALQRSLPIISAGSVAFGTESAAHKQTILEVGALPGLTAIHDAATAAAAAAD